MELKLKNKVALVTGASRGIGAASAKAIAHHGATVVINYIKSKDKAEELLDDIKKSGGKGMIFQADVRDQGAVDDMVESTLKEFGKIGNGQSGKGYGHGTGLLGYNVNVVGPGLTLTDATAGQPKEVHEQVAAITPLRRLGMPDDIAGVVLFLASSLSDYLNGEYIPVTGGSFMI